MHYLTFGVRPELNHFVDIRKMVRYGFSGI